MTSVIDTKFRHDINALRAIAVIAVVLFHFNIRYFEGGFIGVDIFFVISGYLMSRIVLTDVTNGNFNLLGFYIRRVQRIVPALMFLIAVITLITFFLYMPSDFKDVTKYGLSSLLFYSNHIYARTNYFASISDNNIFLHTWSLSVEWQFYLIFPIALIILNKIAKNNLTFLLIIFLLTSIASFTLAYFRVKHHQPEAFYYLPPRAWEMLVGGIAFLIQDKLNYKFKFLSATLGYLTLLASVVMLTENTTWPGFYTLIPVLATFTIIISNHNFDFLKNPVLKKIGETSYSIYLWHWPLFVLIGYCGIQSSPFVTLALIIGTGIMGFGSYKFIESPTTINTTRFVFIRTFVLACIIIGINKTNLNRYLFKKEAVEISNYKSNHAKELNYVMSSECKLRFDKNGGIDYPNSTCLGLKNNQKNVLLIGDSHSQHLSQSLRQYFLTQNINLLQSSMTGCMPLLRKNGSSNCSEAINQIYYDFIPNHPGKINTVILSANWVDSKNKEILIEDLKATITYLHKLKIKCIILGQNETYITTYPSIASREVQYQITFSTDFIEPSSAEINDVLRTNIQGQYIDIYSIINPKLLDNIVPYMFDNNHFTKYGAEQTTRVIVKNKVFKNVIF